MPEGPEVRIISEQLNAILSNCVIDKLITDFDLGNFTTLFKHNTLTINNVKCKGKFIYFELISENDKKYYFGNHLGMTGHWRTDKGKHTKVQLEVNCRGEEKSLFFDDARKFGKFTFLTEEELKSKLNKLGPDVMSKQFTVEVLQEVVKNTRKPIAVLLMEQNTLSGIGNYLRSDIMYKAKIHPKTPCRNLTNAQIKKLYKAIVKVTEKSYSRHGTTIRTYKDIKMQPGNYETLVYDKKMDSLGNKVEKMSLGGRTVFYVPEIQK